MSASGDAFSDTVCWLARYAGFPAGRLPPQAEAMLCVAALAAEEETAERRRFVVQSRDAAQSAALRSHGLRRAQVHFKCDNSAKV